MPDGDAKKSALKVFREVAGEAAGLMQDDRLLAAPYLDSTLMDSLQFVDFVAKLEEKFGIRFTHQDLESEQFRTLGGVAGIIAQHLKK